MPPSVVLKIPLSVGRYQMTGRTDAGIPGAHRARDPETDGLVTVYLYPDDAAAARRTERALAAPEHPNVLRVIDAGREGSFSYLVTEWVDGATLARRIQSHSRLPEADVIRFLAQVGQAMDFARTGDEVPFPLTAAHVLIRQDGVAKVIPFELPGEEAAREAAAGKGVPFAEVIFALGTTLHESLTGWPWAPPEEPPPGRRRRYYAPPPRPAGLTDRAERAVRRATDPDPAKRPPSCAEFLRLLRARPVNAGAPKPDRRQGARAVENRRGYVRYSLGLGANCTIRSSVFEDAPPSTELWPLVVQDVSAGGIGILLARRCEAGTELSVELTGDAGRAPRSLPVKVVHVRKELHGHWAHGCTFLQPLDDAELLALVNHLGRSETA
jgi:hypothetical protein